MQIVHRQFLKAEQDEGVGTEGNFAEAHRPARYLLGSARKTPPDKSAEGSLDHRVRKMHLGDISLWPEDRPAADIL